MLNLKDIPSLDGKNKKELVDMLLREEYGDLPSAPLSLTAEILERSEKFCAGHAVKESIVLTAVGEWGSFSFPITYVCPKGAHKKHPAFIHINFRSSVPDEYQPTEETRFYPFAIRM